MSEIGVTDREIKPTEKASPGNQQELRSSTPPKEGFFSKLVTDVKTWRDRRATDRKRGIEGARKYAELTGKPPLTDGQGRRRIPDTLPDTSPLQRFVQESSLSPEEKREQAIKASLGGTIDWLMNNGDEDSLIMAGTFAELAEHLYPGLVSALSQDTGSPPSQAPRSEDLNHLSLAIEEYSKTPYALISEDEDNIPVAALTDFVEARRSILSEETKAA